ncbi:hypothetical protein F5Y07DRAFT_370366 [Xylaria sp. FL0933]|nr:hypothetical protein F5Y07DRAFT_370366 [Xylaria sp. FL0933]
MVILATLFPPACLLSVGSMQLLAKANHGWDVKGSKGLIFKPQAVPKVPMPRMCLVQYSLHGTLLQVGIRHTAGRTRTSMPKPSRCCVASLEDQRAVDAGIQEFYTSLQRVQDTRGVMMPYHVIRMHWLF